MGWFSAIKGFASRAVGAVGNVLKKVGHFAEPIIRKVGDWAPTIGNIAGYGLDAVGGALAQPELIALGEGIRRGANWLGSAASKAADISNSIGNIGGKAVDFSNVLGAG
jgi:hypothetical protein